MTGCKRVSTDAINLSEFIVLDTDKKQLTSASMGETPRTEDIEGLSSTDKNIFLYGTQGEDTWNATISLENGASAAAFRAAGRPSLCSANARRNKPLGAVSGAAQRSPPRR